MWQLLCKNFWLFLVSKQALRDMVSMLFDIIVHPDFLSPTKNEYFTFQESQWSLALCTFKSWSPFLFQKKCFKKLISFFHKSSTNRSKKKHCTWISLKESTLHNGRRTTLDGKHLLSLQFRPKYSQTLSNGVLQRQYNKEVMCYRDSREMHETNLCLVVCR
jgi:hypothetical protein